MLTLSIMAFQVFCSSSLGLHGRSSTGCFQPYMPAGVKLHRLHQSDQLSSFWVLSCPRVLTRSSGSSAAWTTISHEQNHHFRKAASTSATLSLKANSDRRNVLSLGSRSTRARAFSAGTVQPSSPVVEVEEDDLNLVLELAKSEEKLRAAATLRARSFYSYPEGRSITAQKMHQKMKADDEWAVLTRKIGGLEQGYKRTSCVIAACPSWEVADTGTDLHESCMVTGPRAEKYLLVGTLDLNQGLSLPGEVIGECPTGPEAELGRAYLSNVCVAEEVRRRGVGMVLVEYAMKTAKLWGISDLYVHVVVENISARKLYEKAGFVYEKEESVKEARSLGRPRRYLLRTHLI